MNAVELSLFVNRLQAVCTEMGATLCHTAFSPNIKDRLDYSCAIFDAGGELCAQAAHIPVHLGSMAYAMAGIVSRIDWQPGDMMIVNDPYLGGTHLPDVTLIAPLFIDDQLTAFCANRAHHADIGCSRPGSMPLASHLDEEGLVLSPRHYLRAGEPDRETRQLLETRLRNPQATLGDFAAQVSANRVGLERLFKLADALARDGFLRALTDVNRYARKLALHTLEQLPGGSYRARDRMDGDGLAAHDVPLEVCITLSAERAVVDFTGSAAMVGGNINCPLSVTAAAAYYVLYALMPADTPPCAGSMSVMELIVPAGSILNARAPAAVAAGNVETSQRIVDVMLAALAPAALERIPAASQGTMNNLAMGAADWDYYETLAGGTGAHAGADGLNGVHSHMTNTLNTPVEVLEMNYPLRVHRYALRSGSGGHGRHQGGDGVIREYEFLTPCALTVLSERREFAPPGCQGGAPGTPGRNALNGSALPGKCELDAAAGDRLVIETPGGGGWGAAAVDA